MKEKTTTFCIVCGALVGPGVRFCSRFCKLSAKNDKALPKKTNKHKANKARHKSKRKKAKR